jgi:hypothetical protein
MHLYAYLSLRFHGLPKIWPKKVGTKARSLGAKGEADLADRETRPVISGCPLFYSKSCPSSSQTCIGVDILAKAKLGESGNGGGQEAQGRRLAEFSVRLLA